MCPISHEFATFTAAGRRFKARVAGWFGNDNRRPINETSQVRIAR